MSVSKKLGIVVLAVVASFGALEVGEGIGIPGFHSFVATAMAVVDRPLTPVSVSGVAGRTTRRCAAGVYYC
jgi:hypothetical protein